MKIRIAKFIADTGAASRRKAEELIARGAVTVNGVVVTTPVSFVEESDIVAIDGKKLEKRLDTKLYIFHKPINTVTTTSDPNGRKTIYDILPQEYKH